MIMAIIIITISMNIIIDITVINEIMMQGNLAVVVKRGDIFISIFRLTEVI